MFIIRQHKEDRDMLEIITRKTSTACPRGVITLWAVVHEDFLYEAMSDINTYAQVRYLIAEGKEVEF